MDSLDIISTLIGLVYLFQEYKAIKYLWLTSIIMPAIDIFKYYSHGLYADMGINIYYLFAAIYGWFVWTYCRKHNQQEGESLPITHFKPRLLLPCGGIFLILFFSITWILIHYTPSTVPWWDSFTTSLSIIGLWMLARKYAEQWLVWFVVDAIYCGLYWYKDLPFTACLYTIYTIIAIIGYRHWLKMMVYQSH